LRAFDYMVGARYQGCECSRGFDCLAVVRFDRPGRA
jgi:hypothetical protein